MPNVLERESLPLTFELKDDLLAKLESLHRRHRGATKSQIVRYAISTFDYSSFMPETTGQRQMSVRLSPELKATLLKTSRQKGVSIGELLRVALEKLPANLAGLGTVTKTVTVEKMKKAAKKKAAKKVAKKKTAKKAAKKPAKKKAAKKKPAKKKAAKKAAKKPAKKKAAKKAKKK
jgi:predicted DNA-binding protein